MDVLQCLKKYASRLDLEIAKEMGVPARHGPATPHQT